MFIVGAARFTFKTTKDVKSGIFYGNLTLCRINDRVISANNISLEGVDYATAVQVLRDSGQSVNLVVKRRLVLPPNNNNNNQQQPSSIQQDITTESVKVTLSKNNRKKDEFGIVLGCKIYIKEILHQSLADRDDNLNQGDFVNSINGLALDGMSLKEAKKLLDTIKDKLELVVYKSAMTNKVQSNLEKLTNLENKQHQQEETGKLLHPQQCMNINFDTNIFTYKQ